jgi:hypothetical protein
MEGSELGWLWPVATVVEPVDVRARGSRLGGREASAIRSGGHCRRWMSLTRLWANTPWAHQMRAPL